jgi:hypothetical protein
MVPVIRPWLLQHSLLSVIHYSHHVMPFDVFTKFSDWLCKPQYIPGQFFKHFPPQNSAKKAGGLLNLSRKWLNIMTRLLTGHCPLKGYLFKFGLVDRCVCGRCKQAFVTASHVLCDCKALVVLRFRHLAHRSLTQGDFADISISKVQSTGLLNA